MANSVITLGGLKDGAVDPFDLPNDSRTRGRAPKAAPAPRKTRRKHDDNPYYEPLPNNPAIGDVACRWNPRKKRWAMLTFVGKGTGKGQSRSGWIIKQDTKGFCARR